MIKNKKFTLICCIIAALGLLISLTGMLMGGIITGISLSSNGLQVYKGINKSNIDSNTYISEGTELDPFSSINIEAAFATVSVVESESGKFEIAYEIYSSHKPVIEVKNNRLTVRVNLGPDNGFQFMLFGTAGLFSLFNSSDPSHQIIISVPKGTLLTEVKGELPSGTITLEDFATDRMALNLTFGTMNLNGIFAKECVLSLDSGTLKLENVTADTLSIDNNFGSVDISNLKVKNTSDFNVDSCNISVDHSDFGDLHYQGSFGDLNGQQITARSLNANLESGDISLDELTSQKIEIDNSFGKIRLGLSASLESYAYNISTDFGRITVGGKEYGSSFTTPFENGSDKTITIEGDSTDIIVSQAE